MNKKILEWIGLTLSLIIAGSSLYFMIGRLSANPRDVLETYDQHVILSYSDNNMFDDYVDQIIDSYNESPEIRDILFPEIDKQEKNTPEPNYDEAMTLMNIDDMENVTGLLGPAYDRSDLYGTGTGVVILNVEKTDTYRYKAIPSKDSGVPQVGAFIWTLVDANKNPMFFEDDFSQSFQGQITLDPGVYFLYYDFDQLKEGIDVKLIFN